MKIKDLFEKLALNKKDSYTDDFLRVNFLFENYSSFINSLFKEDYLEFVQKSRPVHFARILSERDFLEYKKFFTKNSYKLRDSFNSFILGKELQDKYRNDSISAVIKKISNAEDKEIEVFVINSGMTEEEIKKENLLLRHFAIEINQKFLDKFIKALDNNGFNKVGEGINKEEGSKVLYFQKNINEDQVFRLEIFEKI